MPNGVIVNGAPAVDASALGTGPIYVGWGIGTGVSAITDTTLFTEVAGDLTTTSGNRVLGTPGRVTTTFANDTYTLTATLRASQLSSSAITVTNLGLWDNITIGSGHLFGKVDISQPLFNGDFITVTFQCPITN